MPNLASETPFPIELEYDSEKEKQDLHPFFAVVLSAHIIPKVNQLSNRAKKSILVSLITLLFLIGGLSWLYMEGRPVSEEEIVVQEDIEPKLKRAILFFAGDMMFDRYIRQKAEEGNYSDILLDFEKKISGADVAIANLEGPITSNASLSLGTNVSAGMDHFTFTFDPRVAEVLGDSGFDIVSLANNHSMNFGEAGIVETRAHLIGSGINFFGDPLDGRSSAYSMTTRGINISFVGYNQFGHPDEMRALGEVTRLNAEGNFVVVVPHWGEEYQSSPTPAVRDLAYAFVDAGADLVIGAHSHIIGDNEIYKGIPVYYSLGNFVFDQYFQEEVRCGLVLEVSLEEIEGEVVITNVLESDSWLSEDGRTLRKKCR